MQLIFRFGFLKLQNITLALADWHYLLLVVSTVSIAAGGYIINNIFDVATDTKSKPQSVVVGTHISESKAYSLYFIFTVIGVFIGFYLSNVIGKPGFAALFIIIAATLYLYATSLKQSLLIGNIIVAFLISLSILIIGIFDLFPITNLENKPVMGLLFKILLDYAVFAFMINFIREIVKDLEDIDGDTSQGMNTLPIFLGISKTTKLVLGLSLIPILCILHYLNYYLFANDLLLSTVYGIVFILAPLIYFTIKIGIAKSQEDYHHLSSVLKWVLFFGIISIAIITFNMKNHA